MFLLKKYHFSKQTICNIFKLSIIPILLFFLSYFLIIIKGPYYLGCNFDPDYAYLFNSLLILHSMPPTHIDHPGTTVQLMGAAIIFFKHYITYLFQNTSLLQYDVLTNPESYLRTINFALISLISLFNILMGIRIYKLQKNWLLIILFQISPLLFKAVMQATTRVSPEPVLILTTIMLSYTIIPIFLDTKDDYTITLKQNILIGFILGFGIATKVTMIPLILILLLSDGLKNKIYSIAACMFSFLFFTLPIAAQYSKIFNWLINIAIHTGKYGSGSIGFPGIAVLWNNTKSLINGAPSFFIFVGMIVVFTSIFFFKRKNFHQSNIGKKNFKGIVIISMILISQIIITLKHPSVHYMIPSMALGGIAVIILLNLTKIVWKQKFQYQVIRNNILIIIIICISFSFFNTSKLVKSNLSFQKKVIEIQKTVDSFYNNYHVINYYGSSSIQHALFFGNTFSRRAFRKILNKLYPNTIVYNILSKQFCTYTHILNQDTLKHLSENGTTFLMRGKPFKSEYNDDYPPVKIEKLDQSSSEALYLIQSFNL